MSTRFTILEANELLKTGKITSLDLLKICKQNYDKYCSTHNIFISNNYTDKELNKYSIPMGLKDVFFWKDTKTTAASEMLKDFISPFDSTVAMRLCKNANAYFVGKLNTDEFTMGGTCTYSYFGPAHSPWRNNNNEIMCTGGSSGGSAAAVASGAVLAATGTDTGGSIRLPAAWCGVIGLKPTCGVWSRYGVIAFAVKFDTTGILTQTVSDCKYLFDKVNQDGKDINDMTSVTYKPVNIKTKKIAFIKEFYNCSSSSEKYLNDVKKLLEQNGYEFYEYSIPEITTAVSVYYTLAPVYAASELAKYNGILYGNPLESIAESRKFGPEVKRRILFGYYIMNYRNDTYHKAQKIISILWGKISKIFESIDLILAPVGPDCLTLEQALNGDVDELWKVDLYTCWVNMLGLPAISVPVGLCDKGAPVGIQLISKPFGENLLFDVAQIIDNKYNFCKSILWSKF